MRVAGPTDADAVRELDADAFARASAADWFAAAATEVLVVEEEPGSVIGFLAWRRAADEAEIVAVAVRPPARRRGAASALVARAAARAAEAGANAMFLDVAADNEAARALYAAAGFEAVGRRARYYASGADALVMRRSPPAPECCGGAPAGSNDVGPAIAHAENGSRPMDRLEKICVDKGMRMTDQRRVIARVLSLAEDHPDVEEIHRRAAEIDQRISIATVYRTMRLFEEAGVVERHDFQDGRARYEEASEDHHDHLIDVRSGEVIEFVNEEIEKLQERIAAEHGYKLVAHRLELYGVPLPPDERRKG